VFLLRAVSAALYLRDPHQEIVLFLSLVTVCVIGLLIGLRFRASALIAATGATVVGSGLAFGFDGNVGRNDFVSVLVLVLALQLAYLAGLFLVTVWRRFSA
jgi:uncharacterized membrane protein